MVKPLLAALAALTLAVPIAAQAQDVPSYAQGQPSYANGEENIHGRIVSFDGGYNLQVRDEQGYVDNVQLHQGTIINPTGLTLEPGMVVSILGYNAGPYLAANEIDTPYTYYSGMPWYGGHPWNYYGPSISLGFFFGNPGWWHGGYFNGGYRWVGGARVYNNVRIRDTYQGGQFRGRDYVAPPERGGYYPNRQRNVDNNRRGDQRNNDHPHR
jgi:hypothetical protein